MQENLPVGHPHRNWTTEAVIVSLHANGLFMPTVHPMAPKHVSGPSAPSQRESKREDVQPGERRSRHRVADDQKSGQGAMSALSRLQMMERRKAALKPDPTDPVD